MDEMTKLGEKIQTALDAEVAADLVAAILTTSHGGRLRSLFQEASTYLLAAHREAMLRPFSASAKNRRDRAKACLDLIRARTSAIGSRKPTVHRLISLLDANQASSKVVAIRRAA